MGPKGNVLTYARMDAAVSELTTLGIAPRKGWIIPADFSLEAGSEAAKKWIDETAELPDEIRNNVLER